MTKAEKAGLRSLQCFMEGAYKGAQNNSLGRNRDYNLGWVDAIEVIRKWMVETGLTEKNENSLPTRQKGA